jgi:hypothetical protein
MTMKKKRYPDIASHARCIRNIRNDRLRGLNMSRALAAFLISFRLRGSIIAASQGLRNRKNERT